MCCQRQLFDFHEKKKGGFYRSEWGDFLLRFLEGYLKQKCQAFQMDCFILELFQSFLESVCVCLSFFGTGCISRHWQFRSLAGSECLGS